MARLRYLQNARTGTAGTISKDTKPIQFYDDDMYIYASADGVLEIVSDTTLTLTAPTINIASSTVSAFTYPITIDFDCTATSVSCLTITSDSESTTGGTNILPLYVNATMSGSGGVGRAIEGKLTVSGSLGGWGNAIKGYTDCTSATGTTGLLSAMCAELKLPSATLTTGMYAVLELNWVGQTNTNTQGVLQGVHTSLIYANVGGGVATDFDSNGYILEIEGMSAGSGNALYNGTLRIAIDDTAYYLPMSTAQGTYTTAYPINVGTSSANVDLAGMTQRLVEIHGDVTATFASGSLGLLKAKETISGNSDVTGTGAVLPIMGQIQIEGHTSTTLWSSTMVASCISGWMGSDNTSDISQTNGHLLAGWFTVGLGQYYVGSSLAFVAGMLLNSETHASATMNGNNYSAIRIMKNTGKLDWTTALDIQACTYLLRIEDDSAVAKSTAASPLSDIKEQSSAGYIRVLVGTSTVKYIALYDGN